MSDERVNSPAQTQKWSAQDYDQNARFVADLAQDLIELLNPQSNERILDIGCGDGHLTARILKSGATVVGIDSSSELLAAASNLRIDARHMDAQKLAFQNEFDAVFSNAALHWMPDFRTVIRGVENSLKPGGRFVGEFGGHGNVAAICTALIAVLNRHGVDGASRFPWFFPTPEFYSRQLVIGGFDVLSITLIPRPTALPSGMRAWLNTFANPFLHDIDEEKRCDILDEVCALLSASLRDDQGRWTADYMRLRFAARTKRTK